MTVGGLVDRPRSFSMDELLSLPSVTITTTLVRRLTCRSQSDKAHTPVTTPCLSLSD